METSVENYSPPDKSVEKMIELNRELFGPTVEIIDATKARTVEVPKATAEE